MTMTSAAEAAERPIPTDRDVQERVAALIGPACRTQLWLMFLDEGDVQLPVLLPCDDVPDPVPEQDALLLAQRLGELTEELPIAQVIFAWERPGGPVAGANDTRSARAMARACARWEVRVRAQLLSHDFGVRLLTATEIG